VKIALYILGGLVALFVGSAIVVGMLEGLGVIESSEDGGQSSESKPSGGDQDRAGNGKASGGDRGGSSPRWPTTRVLRVIDGDTVDTDKLDRVRLIGVNTPEEGRCYDTAATRFTEQRLGGQVVGYELGVERKDRYGRTLAYLYRDENMHNFDLVRRGYARVLTIPPNDKYESRFRRAAQRAQQTDVGVWGICEQRIRRAQASRRARRLGARRLARERARAARQRRERERNRPSTPPAPDPPSGGGGGGSCLPSSACPGKRDGDGDGCYCE